MNPTEADRRAADHAPDPFGPPTLQDAYACGLINARHAAREAMAGIAYATKTENGRGSLAARRALARAEVAVTAAITTLIEGAQDE